MQKNITPTVREQILNLHSQYKTAAALSRDLHVSREYIRQVANKLGITKWKRPERPVTYCPICGKPKKFILKTCSRPCGYKYYSIQAAVNMVERTCMNCGIVFFIKSYRIRKTSPAYFCSERCKGAYAGKHYGWGAGRPRKSKHKHEYIWWLSTVMGLKPREIATIIGVKPETISNILCNIRRKKDVA